MNAAIEKDINNAYFIENFTPQLVQKVLDTAVSKKYILVSNSLELLKKDYGVALNSIRQDPNSANFVDWTSMTKEKFNNLIQEAINVGYLLSEQSCDTLASNFDIISQCSKFRVYISILTPN